MNGIKLFLFTNFLVVFAIVITGERLSFLAMFAFSFYFFTLILKYKKIKFSVFLILSIITIFSSYNFNNGFKSRYNDFYKIILNPNQVMENFLFRL